MPSHPFYFWKQAPFFRLLIALISGIIIQWEFQLDVPFWSILFFVCGGLMLSFFFLPAFSLYRLRPLFAIAVFISLASAGAMLVSKKDIRNHRDWIGNHYRQNDAVIATLLQPPVKKPKSYKTLVSLDRIFDSSTARKVTGKAIIYFRIDSIVPTMKPGTVILFTKPLQEIKSQGNPGTFDYRRYCLFRQTTYQVFLESGDYEILPQSKPLWLSRFLYNSRERIINILRTNIHGEKERGLAEALLIGYKDDLDPVLVQAYSRTGVVHIIAISGLHLGLIYWLLIILLKPIRKFKKIKWIRPVFIILGLWAFSLLSGAQPSILRSALMFTCIVLGESLSKQSSIYNSLALSAFILLVYNPFWLWDPGFQLSYAAVLSIVIFQRSISNWWIAENKMLQAIWNTCAVSIAAQILTSPISIFLFHQFPVLFLITNLVAVPLSSIIVLGEIFLCALPSFPALASISGNILENLINRMNKYIEWIDGMPFASWNGLQIDLLQAIFLFLFIFFIRSWLIDRSPNALKAALLAVLSFSISRSNLFLRTSQQRKILIYNLPQQAIDFIDGRRHFFGGDHQLVKKNLNAFTTIQSAKTLYRLKQKTVPNLMISETCIIFCGKKILLWRKGLLIPGGYIKPRIDLLIISKNSSLDLDRIANGTEIKQVVVDGTSPAWKKRTWKIKCDELSIPFFDVSQQGAFVMNIP